MKTFTATYRILSLFLMCCFFSTHSFGVEKETPVGQPMGETGTLKAISEGVEKAMHQTLADLADLCLDSKEVDKSELAKNAKFLSEQINTENVHTLGETWVPTLLAYRALLHRCEKAKSDLPESMLSMQRRARTGAHHL